MTDPSKINFVCGECFHWVLQEASGPVTIGAAPRGICYGAPPTAWAIINKGETRVAAQTNLRPVLPASERACGMFTPRTLMNSDRPRCEHGAFMTDPCTICCRG
jgi:hypothetical protein